MINSDEHPQRVEIHLQPGERVAICRCWKSKKFPFCDGAHRELCAANNDQVGPAIIFAPEQKET